jgi:hypothetical protein
MEKIIPITAPENTSLSVCLFRIRYVIAMITVSPAQINPKVGES